MFEKEFREQDLRIFFIPYSIGVSDTTTQSRGVGIITSIKYHLFKPLLPSSA